MLTQFESWVHVLGTGHSSPSGSLNHPLRHEHIQNVSNASQQVDDLPTRVPYTCNAMPVLLDKNNHSGIWGACLDANPVAKSLYRTPADDCDKMAGP